MFQKLVPRAVRSVHAPLVRLRSDLRPQFLVNSTTGFLPRKEPVAELPEPFTPLEKLLQDMPWVKRDGTPGLLQQYKFGDASKKIPDYTKEIEGIRDTAMLSALFRDYTFWASAYLLEPCHHNMLQAGDSSSFGLGRDTLPLNISSPLLLLAEKLGAKPFMEYALSYALYNWRKKDPKGGMKYENLDLIRSFSGGAAEHGFILVHVTMVSNTPGVVKNTLGVLHDARNKDRSSLDNSLKGLQKTLNKINREMDTMWSRSNPEGYNDFRTFIMGIKDQPMFPGGVYYEGRDAKGKIVKMGPFQYRGESGANDSIIPTCDNLLQLTETMPDNPLTEILRDFRTYRPVQHNAWLTYVHENAKLCGIKEFAMADSNTAFRYLTVLDEVRDFRNRHWNFTKEYILKRTLHPVATGGSPIVTWLPNQLSTVLKGMGEVLPHIKPEELSPTNRAHFKKIQNATEVQLNHLTKEVEKLKGERKVEGGARQCPY